MMKRTLVLAILSVLQLRHTIEASESSSSSVILTSENFETATANRNLFVFFFDPQCAHCQTLQAVWEKLAADYVNHQRVLIGKFNCRENAAAERFCSDEMGLYGLPSLQFGEPSHRGTFLHSYNDDKTYKDLKQFVEKELANKAICSPGNMPACDDATQQLLRQFWTLSLTDLQAKIDASHETIDTHIRNFKSNFDRMQGVYNDREDFHHAMTQNIRDTIRLLKSARASKRLSAS